jgi:spoIIIJ-associated protein
MGDKETPGGTAATVEPAPSSEEQVRRAQAFLEGLISQFGAAATVTAHPLAEDMVELSIQGEELGALIGPKGATLLALQDLTRTVAQRRPGAASPRIVLDVNGYRKQRQEALVRFVEKVAAEVQATNTKRSLEPMNAADRKIVHDAVNPIAGVTTVSEGEEPNRRVVLIPDSARTQLAEPEAPGANLT